MPPLRLLALPLLLLFPACTHISGIVEQSPGRPLSTAIFSVGRPDGIAVYATHHVDFRGHFNFQLGPTDDDNLYVYDGAADPRLTLQHVDTRQLSQNMHIYLPAANPNLDIGPATP